MTDIETAAAAVAAAPIYRLVPTEPEQWSDSEYDEDQGLLGPRMTSQGPSQGVRTKAIAAAIVAIGLLLACSAFAGLKPERSSLTVSKELDSIQESSVYMKDELLERHNIYRCMHGVPALEWSYSLAETAQRDNEQNGFHHSHRSGVGENLAWRSNGYSVRSVDDWYDEIRYTSGQKGRVDSWDGKTGHYTQVVWKGTTHLGCGYSNNVLTCQYSPPGNFMTRFSQNVNTVRKSYNECKGQAGGGSGGGSGAQQIGLMRWKPHHECKCDYAYMGEFSSAGECGFAVRDAGGKFMIFGINDKAGWCYKEKTGSSSCPEGWEHDDYDFYKIV